MGYTLRVPRTKKLSRRSLEFSRRSLDFSRRSLEFSRRSLEFSSFTAALSFATSVIIRVFCTIRFSPRTMRTLYNLLVACIHKQLVQTYVYVDENSVVLLKILIVNDWAFALFNFVMNFRKTIIIYFKFKPS